MVWIKLYYHIVSLATCLICALVLQNNIKTPTYMTIQTQPLYHVNVLWPLDFRQHQSVWHSLCPQHLPEIILHESTRDRVHSYNTLSETKVTLIQCTSYCGASFFLKIKIENIFKFLIRSKMGKFEYMHNEYFCGSYKFSVLHQHFH